MEKQIPKGLKYTFLVAGIVFLVDGLSDLLLPNLFPSIFGTPRLDPGLYRLLGAATLGFTASSWLAYMETAWDRVRIVVLADIVWTILGTLALLWLVFVEGRPMTELGYAILLGGFAAAFCFFYFRN